MLTNMKLGNVTYDFVNGTAYAPLISAPNVTADLHSPWKVPMKIVKARTTLKMMYGGVELAVLKQNEYGDASNTDTQAVVSVTNAPLVAQNKAAFSAMMKEVTQATELKVEVSGSVDTKTQLTIFDEPIDIQGITFNTSITIPGLQGLNAKPSVITGLTVIGGQTDGLILQANATMFNPSTNSINMGAANFEMAYDGEVIGTLQIANMDLQPADNPITTLAKVNPVKSSKAMDVLTGYLSGKQMPITLMGTDQSTNIDSLKDALASIKISTNMPIFNDTLVKGASLSIPKNIAETRTAVGTVKIFDPFEAGYEILGMTATINADSIVVGKVNVPQLPEGKTIAVPPKGIVSAENLPIELNLDPVPMFTLLRDSALKNGLNVKPLDALLTLGGYDLPGMEKVQPDPALFDGFRLDEFVKSAMGKLLVDIDMQATVKIGDFQFVLPYTQKNVIATTDDSIVELIPILGGNIVQNMVNKAHLVLDKTLIKNPSDEGFRASLNGEIQNTGPIPAKISFPSGTQVLDGGTLLGAMQMPPVEAADGKATLNVEGDFKITNAGALTEFTKNLLLNQAATWTITATTTVDALGVTFPNVSLTQQAELTGANGFKDAAKILSFDLPSESEQGGLNTVIDFSLNNPSSVGVEVGKLQLAVEDDGIQLGLVESNGLTIQPKGVTKARLTGRIFRQESQKGLNILASLFSAFMHGVSVPMTSKCVGAIPPSGSAKWLSEALQVVTLQVVLPADPSKANVIQEVSMDQLTIDATPETAYRLDTSSDSVTATIKPPFAFKMNIIELEETITLINDGAPMATLKIPRSSAKTDFGKHTVQSAFKHLPLAVIDNQHNNFNGFVKDLTLDSEKVFHIQGVSNAVTDTPVGTLLIEGIKVNVDSKLKGMQGFQAKPVPVNDVDVVSGRPNALMVSLKTSLFNPSDLTVSLGTVILNMAAANNAVLGQVTLKDFTVVPGDNALSPETVLTPGSDPATAIAVLSNFVAGKDQQIKIIGSHDSTTIESFKEALASISITTTLHGLKEKMIESVSIKILDSTLKDGIAVGTVTLVNPFTAPVSILSIQSKATLEDLLLGEINTTPTKPIVISGKSKLSVDLPVKMNMDPKNLISVLIVAARKAGIDISPIIGALTGSSASLRKRGGDDPIGDLILKVLNSIKADVSFDGPVRIDQFIAPLKFTLEDIPLHFDRSALKIVAIIGAPLVAKNMEASKLAVDAAVITNLKADRFTMEFKGSITNAGKIPATISFPKGLNVEFNDELLGSFGLQPIDVDKNGEAKIDQSTNFAIKDVKAFTAFSGFMLAKPQFSWDINADGVKVVAIENDFNGLKMNKSVTLEGFNGLQEIKVTNLRIVGPSPDKGLTVEVTTDITNPSSVGVELGDLTFDVQVSGLSMGPATAKGVTLAAAKKTTITLDVDIQRKAQTAPFIGILYSNFLAGKLLAFTAVGKDVSPPGSGGNVPWLQVPFKQLSLPITYQPPKISLVQTINVKVDTSSLKTLIVKSDFVVVNPLDAAITINYLKGSDSYKGTTLGSLDFKVPDPGLTVPGKNTAKAEDIPIKLDAKAIPLLLELFKKAKSTTINIPTDVDLEKTLVQVGGLPGEINYSQEGVPTTITIPDGMVAFAAGLRDNSKSDSDDDNSAESGKKGSDGDAKDNAPPANGKDAS